VLLLRGWPFSDKMMAMQHLVTVLFAVATLGTAIAAAAYWFQSARIDAPPIQEPVASISDVPEDHIQMAVANANSVRVAMEMSSQLNKKAAIWTGISALLGAATSIAGIF